MNESVFVCVRAHWEETLTDCKALQLLKKSQTINPRRTHTDKNPLRSYREDSGYY